MNESGLTDSSGAVTAVDVLPIDPPLPHRLVLGPRQGTRSHPAAYNLADDEPLFKDEVSFTPVVRISGGISAPQPTSVRACQSALLL
jgi:hypothetical protein